MIKTPVVVKTEDGLTADRSRCLYRKRASMRARCTFRLGEKNINCKKYYGNDEPEP